MPDESKTRILRKTELEKYIDKILKESTEKLKLSSKKIENAVNSEYFLHQKRTTNF